jgi:hypothetical protein
MSIIEFLTHPDVLAAMAAGWGFGWQISKRLPF